MLSFAQAPLDWQRIRGVLVHKRLALIAVLSVAALALAGCTSTTATAPAAAGSGLLPGYHFTHVVQSADAKAETVREIDAINALIPRSDVASTSNKAEFYSSSGKKYYAILRTITVSAGFDAIAKSEAMEKQLVGAGWIKHTATTDKDTGDYLAGLSSTKSSSTSWFLLLGGNKTPGKASTISIQIGSPDLPNS
jgi:hypothetical protein